MIRRPARAGGALMCVGVRVLMTRIDEIVSNFQYLRASAQTPAEASRLPITNHRSVLAEPCCYGVVNMCVGTLEGTHGTFI